MPQSREFKKSVEPRVSPSKLEVGTPRKGYLKDYDSQNALRLKRIWSRACWESFPSVGTEGNVFFECEAGGWSSVESLVLFVVNRESRHTQGLPHFFRLGKVINAARALLCRQISQRQRRDPKRKPRLEACCRRGSPRGQKLRVLVFIPQTQSLDPVGVPTCSVRWRDIWADGHAALRPFTGVRTLAPLVLASHFLPICSCQSVRESERNLVCLTVSQHRGKKKLSACDPLSTWGWRFSF